MSDASEPVVVAGAGIGGLTVALMLARRGIPVTVIEKRTALVEAGAGIQLSPNASRILIGLGLGAALNRRAVEPEQLLIRSLRDGRALGSMPLGRAIRERHGAPYWVIMRADLHGVLLDAVRSEPKVQLLVGRGVTGVTDGEDHADVAFEAGDGARQTVRTPLLVGADGVWSTLRSVIGDGDPPRFRNFEAWRCVVPARMVPGALAARQSELWLGSGAHIVHYPVAGAEAWNIVVIVSAKSAVDGWGMPMERDRLDALVASLAAPGLADLRALLLAGENWRLWSLHDALPAVRWSLRHATLLGDAAHPVLPFLAQGGALAIEDAAVLVKALATHPGDTPAALAAYEEERYPRVRRVMEESRANSRSFHFSGVIGLIRDMLLHRWSGERFSARYDWLYGWQAE
ncbi:FAD-dependent monooxygenase [Pseudochelatococcus sp. B33]